MESNSETFFVLFILFVSISLFLLVWFGILFLGSRFGGWTKLHKAYPFPERLGEPLLVTPYQSMQIGTSSYNGIIKLSYHKEGLEMGVMILFRFQHPKLFIPWTDIILKEKSESSFTWNILDIGNPAIIDIKLNANVLEQMNPYLKKNDTLNEGRW
jgi:hypothetical protein